jgi:hypothetical protein
MTIVERLAVWYLERRGRFVLPFPFIGMVVGYAVATKTGEDDSCVEWEVRMPKIGRLVVLNNSVVTRREQTHDAPVR